MRDAPTGVDAALPNSAAGSRRWSVWAAVVLGLLIAGWLGTIYAARARDAALAAERDGMQRRADIIRTAVDDWLEDGTACARIAASVASVQTVVSAAEGAAADERVRDRALQAMNGIAAALAQDGIVLVDVAGRPVLRVGPADQDERILDVGRAVLAAGQPVLSLELGRASRPSLAVFAAPVRAAGDSSSAGSAPLGAALVHVDPTRRLFDLLQREYQNTRTGETVLVRQRDGRVELLSPLRFGNAVGQPRLLDDSSFLTRGSLADRDTFAPLRDYRGVPVYAVARTLRHAPWSLVLKVDASELLAAHRERMRRAAAAGIGILLALAGTGFGLWRSQRAAHQASLVAARARMGFMLDQANDAILFVSVDGRIREVNRQAERFYGYERADLIGMHVAELRAGDERAKLAEDLARVRSLGRIVVETVHRHSDGTRLPVEVSARLVELEDEPLTVAVVRDVRERRGHEARIAFLNRLYSTLSEVNQHIVRCQDSRSLFDGVCRILAVQGGFRLAWIGTKGAQGRVDVAACAGPAVAYLEGIQVRWDDTPEGRGPAGSAIREGRAVVVDDTYEAPSFAPWRERAEHHGLHTLAAFPIPVSGRVVGALLIYSAEARTIDEEEKRLVGELAGDVGFALEVLARKDALRIEEERFRALFESSPTAIFSLDLPSYRITSWNPAAERLFGWSAQEAVGRPLPYVPQESRAEFEGLIGRVAAGETLAGLELTRQRKDGSPVEILLVAAPLRDPAGNVTGTLAVALDMSARRHAESELLLKNSALEAAANAISITDRSGAIVWANPAFTTLTGYTLDEAIGRNPRLLKSGVHAPEFYAEMWSRITAGEVWRGSLRNRRKDGSVYEEELTITPLRASGGEITHFIAVQQDVTHQKQLERSTGQLASIVQATPDFVGISAPDGSVLFVNPAGRRMLGVGDTDDITGSRISDYHPPWAARLVLDVGMPTAARDGVWSGETALVARDGVEFPVSQVIVSHRAPDGSLLSLSTIARDMRGQKHLEDQFRQAQKMEAVGRLAGGIAHDFNNVLNVIIGYGEMLKRRMHERDPDRHKVEQILYAAEKATRLTRQLLAFSRKQVLKPRVVDPNLLLAEMESMLGRVIGEDVLLELRRNAGGRVRADRGQLEQVLMNLAVNARDAMPDGGRLTIETSDVELASADPQAKPDVPPGRYVLFQVSDTGSGMDESTRARIFEPFFTTKAEGKGTGLGLATVFGIVEQSGGHIRVESAPGHGTRFRVYLPLVEAPAEESERRGDETRRGRNGFETVLLVEDEPAAREMMAEVLRSEGYEVLPAADGQEAIERAADVGAIHLLVTDVVLPRISGPVVAERLKQAHPDLKVLFVSGYPAEAVATPAGAAASIELLQKPFTPHDLLQRVETLLDSRG